MNAQRKYDPLNEDQNKGKTKKSNDKSPQRKKKSDNDDEE